MSLQNFDISTTPRIEYGSSFRRDHSRRIPQYRQALTVDLLREIQCRE